VLKDIQICIAKKEKGVRTSLTGAGEDLDAHSDAEVDGEVDAEIGAEVMSGKIKLKFRVYNLALIICYCT
jgi:formylmethanofuran dehydrogenase subunit C